MQLLPKSAAAFAPRSSPNIVLGSKVEPWLTQTLKRTNKVKRPLNNPSQHHRCLTETLGGTAAIWTLAALFLPKAPEAELQKDDNPLMEAINNYNMMYIEAYVVHVDMVSQYEVAYKLTTDTIDALIDYHKEIYSVDAAAAVFDWPEKESQIRKLQDEFVQAVNRFVFRTSARALEGLEEDGAGELLDGRSEAVKKAIMHLFAPLLPPPPRIVDIVHPAPMIPSNHVIAGWWHPTGMMATPNPQNLSVDSWRVLPSTPSPTTTSCSDPQSQSWPPPTMALDMGQLPSPTPSCSYPSYTTAVSMYSSPQTMSATSHIMYPSQLPQSCGSLATDGNYNGFSYGYSSFAQPQYATTI